MNEERELGAATNRLGEARKHLRIAAEQLDVETARELAHLNRQLGDVKRDLMEADR